MNKASWSDDTPVDTETGMPVLPPRSAVVELFVIVIAIVGLDVLLPNQGLAEIGPSPYWLPVLLMTLQYGTVSGLLATGVGIAMTMLPGVPEQGVGENHFAYLLRIWAQPILWVAVAVLLGQFRIRQIAVKRELLRQVRQLTSQRQALADYAANLRQRCEAIERDVAGRDEPQALAAVAAVAALADPCQDLDAAFDRAIALVLPGAEASVFALDAHRLHRMAASGWRDGSTWAVELTFVHPLYRAVIERGERLSVLIPGHEAQLGGEGLAVVPICHAAGGGPVGLLKIERVNQALLGEGTLDALCAMAGAIALRFDAQARASDGARQAASHAASALPLRERFRKTPTWPHGDNRRVTAARGDEAPTVDRRRAP